MENGAMFTRTTLSTTSAAPVRGALLGELKRFRFADPEGGAAVLSTLSLGNATISGVETSGHVVEVTGERGVWMLATLEGELRVDVAGRRCTAGPGGAVAIGPGHRRTFSRSPGRRPMRGIGIVLPSAVWHAAAPGFEIASVSGEATAHALLGFAHYALEQAGLEGSPFRRRAWLRAADALVADGIAALAPRAERPAFRADARRVRAARDFMHANAERPLTVADVAAAVGVGARTLQAAFQAELGMGPRETLAEIRLDRARRLLSAPDAQTTVTDAALACGFSHFGRFAAAYRKRFGEAPSETLRRRVVDA